ncbi:MAG: ACT domain-containing protein [Acidobacteria bacterium]|nr:ACT domain-containing protein [Acidobacteriota bacterium]
MAKARQLTVPCENRPGTLAEVAKVLGDAKVNILSCLTTTSGTQGECHFLVDNVNRAKKALAAARLSYTEADVLSVELPNRPGVLGAFAGKLAARGINITLGYHTSVKGSKKACVVLVVSDLDKAGRIR